MFSNLYIDNKAEGKCKYPDFDYSTGKIPNIFMITHSVIDDPGYTTMACFFRGCNLSCPTCCNSVSLRDSTPVVPFNLSDINEFAPVVDSVTLVGGDPLIQDIRSLKNILLRAKLCNLDVNVATNGLRLFDSNIKELYPLMDRIWAHITPEFMSLGLNERLYELPEHIELNTNIIAHPHNKNFIDYCFGVLPAKGLHIKKDFFYGGSRMVPSKI